MSGRAFLRKEIKSITGTYLIWLIPLLFVFLGMLSALTARFMPEIIKSALEADAASGIKIKVTIPEPAAADAYAQWLKNMAQLGLPALILMAMGLIADEITGGTFQIVLAKPVSRRVVVLSKFITRSGLFLLSLFLGAAACFGYALLLFERADWLPLAAATALFSLYALLITAATLLFSALSRQAVSAGVAGFALYVALSVTGGLGFGFNKYSPGALSNMAYKAAAGAEVAHSWYYPVGITTALIAVMLIGAVGALNRREI